MYAIAKLADIYPVLSEDEEINLFRRYRLQNDLQAAEKLVLHNLRFVIKIANQFKGYVADVEDLHQEGLIGLMRAIRDFDMSKGVRLVSYAAYWIKEHIANFVLRNYRIFNLGTTKTNRKLFFNQELLASNDADLKLLGISRKQRDNFELCKTAQVCIDDDNSVLQVVSGEPTPEEALTASQENQQIERLKKAVSELPDRERVIIERRFLSETPSTFQELGDEFGVSLQRIKQIEDKVIKELKDKL